MDLIIRQRFWVGGRFIVDPQEFGGRCKLCGDCGELRMQNLEELGPVAIPDIYGERWYTPIKRRSLEQWC